MIALEDIHFHYPGQEEPALSGLWLEVHEGETVGVVGPNGAGKSTLLRLVVGGLRPRRGTVRVAGTSHLPTMRARTGFCPDHGGVYPFLTAAEHGRFLAAQCRHWHGARFEELMAILNLPPRRTAGTLSRGQCARLRLALALAQDVPVWVLDEPLAGIDPESREAIVAALSRYLGDAPRTVLMATHEVDEIETLVDRVVLLDAGGVRVDSPAEDLRQRSGDSVEAFVRKGAWR